jgi:E1A-binding protein p400
MELWSLMHFLMPHVFRSRKEFQYWFSSPLTSMVGGERSVADDLVKRLHSILRPFVLRRLKKDVETQVREHHSPLAGSFFFLAC